MTAMGYNPDDISTDPATPAGVGNQAAAAVLAFRANDGSNQANGYADTSGYVPVNTPDTVNGPFHWQPLRVPDGNGGFNVQKFLTPHWRAVTPFALTSPDQFKLPGSTPTTCCCSTRRSPTPCCRAPRSPICRRCGPSTGRTGRTARRRRATGACSPGDLPGARLQPGQRRQDVLRARQRRAGLQHRGVERQAGVGLRPADHRRPRPQEEPARAGLGRPIQGHQAHLGSGLAALPAGDLPDPAIPRVRLRAQHLQRRRRGGPPAVHRQ
jgi:hypothetical protein